MAEKHVSEKDGERVNFAELNMDYNHGLDVPKDEQAQWQ
jgi:hypothetical protein